MTTTTSHKAPLSLRGWFVFYNLLVVPLLFVAFHAGAWLSPKVRAGIKGRSLLLIDIARQLRAYSPQRPRLWIHAASMGEYEQARPIIRELKQRLPECVIVLSFFSPSGFEHVQKSSLQAGADVICYLPFDSRWRARRFMRVVQPDAGVVIRHDLWPNHLREAKKRDVYLMLASASVHEKSSRHKPVVRSFNRVLFDYFDAVCAISENAAAGLQKFVRRPERLLVTGDTRYDQVLFRSREKTLDGVLPAMWREQKQTFIAGSVWPEDAAVVVPAFAAARKQIGDLLLMIVPHEPTREHVEEIEVQCKRLELAAMPLSQWREPNAATVLIVDRLGILANLYGVGQVAFVGGGFGPGIHNVLEAAVHGLPVLFGPRMRNSAEAIEMVEGHIGHLVHDSAACEHVLIKLYRDDEYRRQLAERSRAFVIDRCGASARLVDVLQEALRERQEIMKPEAPLF